MFKFIKHFKDALKFNALPADMRRLTFYSEGKNYWPHLGKLLLYVLDNSDIPICFITSDEEDPVLEIDHPQLNVFVIDDGAVRNWLFENIETDIFLMTMPDIGQYQVKRSKHNVHYVYVQHSLLSLHMVYREGAFDHYDTIFCAGPHHVREMQAIEKARSLKPKNLVEHGYEVLDSIVEESKNKSLNNSKTNDTRKHVLLAPSWGPNGVIELGIGAKLASQILADGYKLTLRPHPETIKHSKSAVEAIVKEHSKNPLFNYEANVSGLKTLHDSDILISAWSGIALEYAFGLGKPVVFIDVPNKMNNPNYRDIPLEPVEIYIRDELGALLSPDNLKALEIEKLKTASPKSVADHVFNLGRATTVGGDYIINMVRKLDISQTE